MWKPLSGVVLSTAFAIGLTVTPLPERWRMPVIIVAWSICAVAAFGWGFSRCKDAVIAPSDMERKVSQWIDRLGLSRKILFDEKTYFGFQVSLPPRIIISITRGKKRPSYLTLNSRIRMNDNQRALFD